MSNFPPHISNAEWDRYDRQMDDDYDPDYDPIDDDGGYSASDE